MNLGSSEDIHGPVTDVPQESDTATAILKKKKKPNSLMYVFTVISEPQLTDSVATV